MPLSVANRVFEELDTAQHTDREKGGYTGAGTTRPHSVLILL